MDLVIDRGERERWIRLEGDIYGEVSAVPCDVTLRLDEDLLSMRARAGKPAFLGREIAAGAWFFGLWEYDCAELFLLCSSTGRYLEVNLAPNGAHWVGVFDAPRHQVDGLSAEGWASTSYEMTEAAWSSEILIDWAKVVDALGGMPDRGNVTAILDGKELRSFAPIDVEKPDFHVPERWRPVVMA